MEEKKFSMIVLAFIFMVAIPSIIFLFSNNAGNTGNAVMQQDLYPAKIQYAYDGMVTPPEDYQNYQDLIRKGKQVAIYDDAGIAHYVIADATASSERSRYNVDNSYTALKNQDCPIYCFRVSSVNAANAYASSGQSVIQLGDSYCIC